MAVGPSASSLAIPVPAVRSLDSITLPNNLQSLIARMWSNSISPGSSCHFSVAYTEATNHMFPNKLAFISYKTIFNLQVLMGNNSYLPVLIGQGTAIISLNGQRILVCHTLQVPGLAVPLYSLRAHLKQHGCGFWGTSDSGTLVYFPWFVLLVDTLLDCHLSHEPLVKAAQLNTLHYVQPRCPPSLYPLETPPLSCTVSHTLAFIKMTLLLMSLRRLFLLILSHSPVPPWFLLRNLLHLRHLLHLSQRLIHL